LTRSLREYAPSTSGSWPRASPRFSTPASAASRACSSAAPFATSGLMSCAPWIPSCVPSATSIPPRITRTGSRRNRPRAEGIQLACQLGWVSGGRLANETLAEICGHLATNRAAIAEQRHRSTLMAWRCDGDQSIRQIARSDHLQKPTRLRVHWVANHGKLDRPAQVEIECCEEAAESLRRLGRGWTKPLEGHPRSVNPRWFAEQCAGAEQHIDGHRRARGHGVVGDVLRSHHELLLVRRRVEECGLSLIPERRQHLGQQSVDVVEPRRIKGRFIQAEQPIGDG